MATIRLKVHVSNRFGEPLPRSAVLAMLPGDRLAKETVTPHESA
jgi:hypothetical protein